MTTEKKTTGRCPKWNRPVSKKFYDFIYSQICCAKYYSETEKVRVDVMMRCFDEYIDKGSVNVDFNNTETVAFAMLQPSIDQAVNRSRRAREAAVRRREARNVAKSVSATVEAEFSIQAEPETVSEHPQTASTTEIRSDEQPSAEPVATSCTNHRAQRREEIRIRRQQKHAKRLQSRRKSSTGICQT